MKNKAYDCPACPDCGIDVGTPILVKREHGEWEPTTDRWYGDTDCNLWCPACGSGWRGTSAQYDQAVKAWLAYEAEEKDPKAEEARRLHGLLKGGTLTPAEKDWLRRQLGIAANA